MAAKPTESPLRTLLKDAIKGWKVVAASEAMLLLTLIGYTVYKGQAPPAGVFWGLLAACVPFGLAGAWWTQYKRRAFAEAEFQRRLAPLFEIAAIEMDVFGIANSEDSVLKLGLRVLNAGCESSILDWRFHLHTPRYPESSISVCTAEEEDGPFYVRVGGDQPKLSGACNLTQSAKGVIGRSGQIEGCVLLKIHHGSERLGEIGTFVGVSVEDYLHKWHRVWLPTHDFFPWDKFYT